MMTIKNLIALSAALLLVCSCETSTYEELQNAPVIDGTVTYETHVEPIIQSNCVSCHSEGGSAEFRPLSTYAEVKDAVLMTDLLDRIQRQNGEPGLMPQTGRMPQTNIDLILQWNEDGLLEN